MGSSCCNASNRDQANTEQVILFTENSRKSLQRRNSSHTLNSQKSIKRPKQISGNHPEAFCSVTNNDVLSQIKDQIVEPMQQKLHQDSGKEKYQEFSQSDDGGQTPAFPLPSKSPSKQSSKKSLPKNKSLQNNQQGGGIVYLGEVNHDNIIEKNIKPRRSGSKNTLGSSPVYEFTNTNQLSKLASNQERLEKIRSISADIEQKENDQLSLQNNEDQKSEAKFSDRQSQMSRSQSALEKRKLKSDIQSQKSKGTIKSKSNLKKTLRFSSYKKGSTMRELQDDQNSMYSKKRVHFEKIHDL